MKQGCSIGSPFMQTPSGLPPHPQPLEYKSHITKFEQKCLEQ